MHGEDPEGVDGAVVNDGPGFSERLAGAPDDVLGRSWEAEGIAAGTSEFTWEGAAEQLLIMMHRSRSVAHSAQTSCFLSAAASS